MPEDELAQSEQQAPGPIAKAIEPVHDDIIRKARMIYANGLFSSGEDSATREEECIRIADWLQMHGYKVGSSDVQRWRLTGAPDGLLWDDVREGSDGIIRGETYPFGQNGEEEVLRRSVAVAENLLAVSAASLRYVELFDAEGNPVEYLYTADGTRVPTGGLRPKNFNDVTNGLRTADAMMVTASKRLTELQEGLHDRTQLVREVAAEIMTAIDPSFEQLEQFREMLVSGKIESKRRGLTRAQNQGGSLPGNLEPIDISEDGNQDDSFDARMEQAREEIDSQHEDLESDAPYMQDPEEEEDEADGEDSWEQDDPEDD